MKVSEIPYKRYTVEQAEKEITRIIEKVKNAGSAEEIKAARDEFNSVSEEIETAESLANCRFTLNTEDEFYNAEMEYYDNAMPLFSKFSNEYEKAMLDSPLRKEAEKLINPRIFKGYEISQKTFSDAVIEDMQKENSIVTEYSKFMGGLLFEFDGEKMPLSVLRGKLEDNSREIREKAAQAIGKTLSENSETLDGIFDELVKIRTVIAKKLGFESFVELGYCRMGRIDYDADMVSKFRKNVETEIVPGVTLLRSKIAGRLGLDRVMFYDSTVSVSGEMPKPVIGTDEIFVRAQKMYDDMKPEIGSFMRRMLEAEAFDVEARKNKWGGGYCTEFPKYKQPFILANFNGSSDDIDTITHEFGHALAADIAFRFSEPDYPVGMETCECHSMSMEFLCHDYMKEFFGDTADKYCYKHLVDALSFIPYGVIVDEFQHIVYENPGLTPQQRNEEYLKLEKRYRPHISFDGIEYLVKGTRWQYQMHIYESPFYYIDYCLAQCVALGFFMLSRKNKEEALAKYVDFIKRTGSVSFEELVENAGLVSPFGENALEKISSESLEILNKLEKFI